MSETSSAENVCTAMPRPERATRFSRSSLCSASRTGVRLTSSCWARRCSMMRSPGRRVPSRIARRMARRPRRCSIPRLARKMLPVQSTLSPVPVGLDGCRSGALYAFAYKPDYRTGRGCRGKSTRSASTSLLSVTRVISGGGSACRGRLRPRAPAPGLGDVVAAVLWVVAIVPPAFGFWLVAGDLAASPPPQRGPSSSPRCSRSALATLAQVAVGYRGLLYEGPAAGVPRGDRRRHRGRARPGGDHRRPARRAAWRSCSGLRASTACCVPLFTPLTGMVFVLVVTSR